MGNNIIDIQCAEPFIGLFKPNRYKVYYGGRGGAKSWAFARALLIQALERPLRILCVREYQTSIADSVHKLLKEQISSLGLDKYYEVQQSKIIGLNGSEFIFKGIRKNADEIKSTEGIDICWVEEGQAVSESSWDLLIPTIRKENSEIWVSFNPVEDFDATYRRFVINPPSDALVVKVGWEDNPWLPETLRKEKDNCLKTDPDAYDWIWGGNCRKISDAQIFRNKYIIQDFTTPDNARFFHGADWGFAQDPTVLVRCFIDDDSLYIDMEAYGIGVELDETSALFGSIPTARKWPIKADSSRPETISFMYKRGFDIKPAKKWQGSVEDGIAYLKSFNKIYIHPRCVHTAEEFRLYSYKVDRISGDILPIITDAHNHCIDALRYSLDGYITSKGSVDYETAYSLWFGGE